MNIMFKNEFKLWRRFWSKGSKKILTFKGINYETIGDVTLFNVVEFTLWLYVICTVCLTCGRNIVCETESDSEMVSKMRVSERKRGIFFSLCTQSCSFMYNLLIIALNAVNIQNVYIPFKSIYIT